VGKYDSRQGSEHAHRGAVRLDLDLQVRVQQRADGTCSTVHEEWFSASCVLASAAVFSGRQTIPTGLRDQHHLLQGGRGLGCLTRVVRLDGQDAGCNAEVLLAGNQRGSTLRSKQSMPMRFVQTSKHSRASCWTLQLS
jgi:hypothetical protein